MATPSQPADLPAVLTRILDQFGRGVIDDPGRLRGLLADLCPGCAGEANVLLLAVQEGLARRMAAMPTVSELDQARFRQVLQDQYGMAEDRARWCVDTWVRVLHPDVRLSGSQAKGPGATPLPGTGRLARRIEALLDEAERYETAKDHARAIETYDVVLALVPDHPEAVALRRAAELVASRTRPRTTQATTPAPTPAPTPAASSRPQVTVDARRGQDLAQAVAAAAAGTEIRVLPGRYTQPLKITRSLRIVGVGALADIVLAVSGADCILTSAPDVEIENLTIQQAGGGVYDAIDASAGRLVVTGCDLSSDGRVGIAIRGTARAQVRGCRVHDCAKGCGVFVYEKGEAHLEDNDIYGNANAGISVAGEATSTIRKNRVHDGKASGVFVCERAAGLLEDNDIFGNTTAGIIISEEAAPTVRRNRIHDGKGSGIHLRAKGGGTIEANEITGNARAGMEVRGGAAPTVTGNRITGNTYEAIWVFEGGGGTYTDNDLSGNKRGPWDVAHDSKPLVRARGNRE